MSDAIIKVENLGKKYRIHHQRERRRYVALRDVVTDKIKNVFSGNGRGQEVGQRSIEDFWALKDVSFEVKQGEVVGIIGRNGAGKSTLLKVLSRITEPSKGRIILRGRVASLLEVGTGFHPELTGRENIFLNGAILGMNRVEIKRKFDEIVAFADVEKFLDTPAKRYSSGMYVRLAFAVAAHLEPDILIVDEVLAVGDMQFQRKCLGKLREVSKGGRTVLFVSHNMGAIQRLCQRCIMLSNGTLTASGATESLIGLYLNDCSFATSCSLENFPKRSGSGVIRLRSFYLEDEFGNKINQVKSGSNFNFVFEFKCASAEGTSKVNIGVSLSQPDETTLWVFYSSSAGQVFGKVPHRGSFRCHVKGLPLKEGRYLVAVRVEVESIEADWPRGMVGAIEVIPGNTHLQGPPGYDGGAPLLLTAHWSVKE